MSPAFPWAFTAAAVWTATHDLMGVLGALLVVTIVAGMVHVYREGRDAPRHRIRRR